MGAISLAPGNGEMAITATHKEQIPSGNEMQSYGREESARMEVQNR
jgi:hypothetical protein